MRFREQGERLPGMDQFWRCPKCVFAMCCTSTGRLSPPRCPFHKVECEQVTEDAFYADDPGEL
jgi:hypothetical protein